MNGRAFVIAAVAGVLAASTPTAAWATVEGVDLALTVSSTLSTGPVTLTVTNVGTEPAVAAELHGTFEMDGDSFWTLTPASTAPCTPSGGQDGQAACPLGDLAVGASVAVVLDLIFPCAAVSAALTVVATGDVDATNDSAGVVISQMCTEWVEDDDPCANGGCVECISTAEVQAGEDQVVDEGAPVVLTGSIFEGCIPVMNVVWTQVGDDPPVSLTPQGYTGATFTAPEVAGDTVLTFRLTVTNAFDEAGSDDVTVTVRSTTDPQSITFDALPDATYGDAPFPVSATATSGLAVGLAVGATDACTLTGTTVTLTGAGSCTVTATQPGDAEYDAAPEVARTFAVAPAPLSLTADDQVVQYGDPLPALTATPSGLVGGDTLSDLTGTLACTTTAVAGSPPGVYPISCDGLSSADYVVTYLAGTLTVAAEDVVVRLAQSNPRAVPVTSAGGTAPAMTFAARITEADDGAYGDIADLAEADIVLRLAPVAGGSAPAPCAATVQRAVPPTATEPGFVDVTCTVPAGTQVDVYDVLVDVAGREYRGRTHGVLTVYDPAAGGTRGGGVVTTPSGTGEFAFVAKRLKSGAVQGRYLYVATAPSGAQSVVKGNDMATLAVKGRTASITGRATVDGIGNARYVVTVTDGAPDLYGQRVSTAAGQPYAALTFTPVAVTSGALTVGT